MVFTELTEAMEEANRLKRPPHLAESALQLFQLSALRGMRSETGTAVAKIWDGEIGPLFPKLT
ncbi:hypothetical protein BJ878DRAFT_545660 [Calycina marina]|uniref:Uncharacterized protein n=1 Tax=Calycina marina TaxID=1763456 RepID=A0A9P7YXP1_9HELO|nr:hypothetical protein BJ878DRAFT_545660 [Calycina marina]